MDSADSVQYSSATRSGDFNNRLPSPNCQSRTTHDALPRFVTVSDPLTALTSTYTYTYDYAGRTDTVVTGGATRKYTYDRMSDRPVGYRPGRRYGEHLRPRDAALAGLSGQVPKARHFRQSLTRGLTHQPTVTNLTAEYS